MLQRMILITLLGFFMTTMTFAEIPTALTVQIAKITADDASEDDRFGDVVALSGSVALVGAPRESDYYGSVYVFERDEENEGNWNQVAKIWSDDRAAGDQFGYSVALSGTTALIGAFLDDDGDSNSGSAYIFERDQGGAGNWGQVAKLIADDAATDDLFGISVALNGTTALVGAHQDDDGGTDTGSAYIFERDQGGAGNWGQVAKLTAADAVAEDFFGHSVALSGTTALVGAYGVDDEGDSSGAAYVFERDQGGAENWGQVTKLTSEDAAAGDWLGFSVALSGHSALVSAHGDDEGGFNSGAAYVFKRDEASAGNWQQVTKIKAGNPAEADAFGSNIALVGATAVIGSPRDDQGALDSGAVYVFKTDQSESGNWQQVSKIKADDASSLRYFGGAVALSGTQLLIGSALDNHSGEMEAGSAYVVSVLNSLDDIFEDGFESEDLFVWSAHFP